MCGVVVVVVVGWMDRWRWVGGNSWKRVAELAGLVDLLLDWRTGEAALWYEIWEGEMRNFRYFSLQSF